MPAGFLLTGFEPFTGFAVNPSWEAARAVAARLSEDVVARLLPVDHQAAARRMAGLLAEVRPEYCLATGLATGDRFRLELRARRPSALPDAEGPDELRGQWPLDAAEASLLSLGAPVVRSEDAGGYVCETTYWALLRFREEHGYPENALFLHVPAVSERFPVAETARCVEAVVRAALGSASR